MPPKDGKKKKSAQVDEELEGLKDLDKKGGMRIQALEKEIYEQKEQMRLAMKQREELQMKVIEETESFHDEKADRRDVMSNMIRQYREMQDYLVQKNTDLEKKIEGIQDEMAYLHLNYERSIKEKDDSIAEKERTIIELDHKMEDLAEEFRSMLQTTLDKMTDKLKAGGEWEVGLLPDTEKLKQFGVEL
ncbi:hypothetical protein BLNAU_8968 [Blattamonas nauphoetae]|uniref:Dynein regulatory complex protein 12 n=1 Tax=Blattamonas nauphoetae TaxID=2049346 RepID=A0ABQ9XWX8_9EUKA|nr:hypothetical protein BLNAU_8968 [Blattamonas nauphoetae]